MIRRSITNRLKELASHFPVVGIIGPRQSGKTTLSKLFTAETKNLFVYLDLEKPTDISKLNEPEIFLSGVSDKSVVLDEIQRMPELFPLLRSLVDEDRRPLKYLILGSASPALLRQASESLAGRIAYIELTPFNLMEIKDVVKMKEHHFFGGFPDAVLAKSHNKSKLWLDSFITTLIERDLPMLGFQSSPNTLRKLLEMLAWSNGNILNYNNIAKSMGVTNHTVKSYIDFLENAFIIKRLYPFYHNQKKRLVKSPKVFIRDTGILHRLLRISDYEQLMGYPLLGNSWEAYAIEQISSLKNPDCDLYFYRTHAGAEVDLIFVKALQPLATVEIKFTSTPSLGKGFYNCTEDLKTTKNFVVTPFSDDYLYHENVRICSLITFISNYLPTL